MAFEPDRSPVIGIVPAAGRATRLPHRSGSKELVIVGDRAIGDYLVHAIASAGADRICIVTAPSKQDIARHFGSRVGAIPIEYIEQREPTGMSDAIDLAHQQLRGATVLMGMPDTLVDPPDSLAQLLALFNRTNADIALALAPTDEPERLGPVNVADEGRVTRIFDKPTVPPHNLVWTVACWNARFTEYLHEYLSSGRRTHPEAPLGLIFQSALEDGFDVRALPFPSGRYIDAGTASGLENARQYVAAAAGER
jgi:glucose-1-phosphate thymidylyltransferase